VARKQGFSFAFPPFCEIETMDFIAYGAREKQFLPFQGDGQK
jgi:hypothetical protein